MKFVFETVNIDLLSRRVREEEAKNSGRRVTRIVLTNNEWCELMRSRGYKEDAIIPPTYKIAVLRELYSHFNYAACSIEPVSSSTVEIVPEWFA